MRAGRRSLFGNFSLLVAVPAAGARARPDGKEVRHDRDIRR
ncbi:hypothetical protein L828_0442 [Mycobacteroides abscessus MAB_030201_1061]|nr:hypothetical protein L835_0422 [Mycobacteroides abscessus MAB_110811_1470]ETZ92494.1 hypothetical protein L828_0442 [Mycobacteroides abscessus MAB_030201_1061]